MNSAEYEHDCLQAISRVFGESDNVSLIESCEASLTVVTDVFQRFSQLLLYRGRNDGSPTETVDVACYYSVKDSIGYTFTLTAPSDCPDEDGTIRDVFFTAARCSEWSSTYEDLTQARHAAEERIAHIRPVRAGHELRVEAPTAWECQSSPSDAVSLAHPAIPSSRLIIQTSVPHGSEIRASDTIVNVADLAVMQASKVPEDLRKQVERSVTISALPVGGPSASARSCYIGSEVTFEWPVIPQLVVMPRCFAEDAALVTLSSRSTEAHDAFEFQVSHLRVDASAGFEEILDFIGAQLRNPEYDHSDKGTVRVRGMSDSLIEPDATGLDNTWVEYHLVLRSSGDRVESDIGLVRLTCSEDRLPNLSLGASQMAATLQFWE